MRVLATATQQRNLLGVSSTFADWTKTAKLRGVPNSDRYRDCLDVCWGAALKAAPEGTKRSDLVKGLWCNPSQAVQRKPWNPDSGGTVTTSSTWYSFEHDCVLDSVDFLRLHGHPALIHFTGLSEREAKMLGEEAFSVPIVTAFLSVFYYLPWAPWWQPPQ